MNEFNAVTDRVNRNNDVTVATPSRGTICNVVTVVTPKDIPLGDTHTEGNTPLYIYILCYIVTSLHPEQYQGLTGVTFPVTVSPVRYTAENPHNPGAAMPAIATTRVCTSMSAIDHEWAIVAEYVGDTGNCPTGWLWLLAPDQILPFIVARDEAGSIVTVQGRNAAGVFVLYAKLRQQPAKASRWAA